MINSAQDTIYRAREATVAIPNTILFTSAGAGILELLATKTLDKVKPIERVVMVDTGTGADLQIGAHVLGQKYKIQSSPSYTEIKLQTKLSGTYFKKGKETP